VRCTPEARAAALRDIDDRNLRRRRTPAEDGRVNFCSNDYLGLARDPAVAAAMAEAAQRHGAGSGASHLVSGHGAEHEMLEQELAEFTGRARALVFSTGYMANLGVLAAFAMATRRQRGRCSTRMRRRQARSSSPTACSAWTATSHRCPSSQRRRRRIKPGSWSTTRTASVSSARPAVAAASTSGSTRVRCRC
jgi:hypothetical protein